MVFYVGPYVICISWLLAMLTNVASRSYYLLNDWWTETDRHDIYLKLLLTYQLYWYSYNSVYVLVKNVLVKNLRVNNQKHVSGFQLWWKWCSSNIMSRVIKQFIPYPWMKSKTAKGNKTQGSFVSEFHNLIAYLQV